MNRFLLTITAWIYLTLCLCSFAATTRPNVVIIVTDDQGWGDVGYHTPSGQVPIETPHMDSFATSGIRLEHFYATAVCSVTRSCLLTGRNSIRTGTNNTRGVPLDEHLMPQTFKANGYQTFMCGKWHLGGSDKNLSYTTVNQERIRIIQEGTEYAPYNRGWDSHYGEYSGAIDCFTHISQEAENPDIPDWWLNGSQLIETTDQQGHGGYSTDLLADKAVNHIKSRDPAKPMLLYLAFNAIHGPVQAPPDYLAKYANIPDVSRRTIAASVSCMDAAIGRVLAALDSEGISDNTIVVWFGDNGGDETKGSLNDPLRGTKGDGYDGAIREPAGIRWPGVLPSGVTSNQYVWVGDLFPTLCSAIGITPLNSKPFDGINLWPNLLSASNTQSITRPSALITGSSIPVAFDTFTDPVSSTPKIFKIIRTRVGSNTIHELYNMDDDPYESTNLLSTPNASAYNTIVASLSNSINLVVPENYKPYIGPPLISHSIPQGTSITLYAPFTSYKAPTVQWRKNGQAIQGGITTAVLDQTGASVTGTYTTTLTLQNVSYADAGTYDVIVSNIAGTTTSSNGILSVTTPTAPTITEVTPLPLQPNYLDSVWITAKVVPPSSSSISRVWLTYNTNLQQSQTIFTETMRSAAITPWTGDLCDNPWTVTASNPNHVRQNTGANHSNIGNPCGLDFIKGSSALTDTMVTLVNSIDTKGQPTSIEFYLATVDLIPGYGWAFQVSKDGGLNYETRLSDLSGSNHVYQLYHYDLTSTELTDQVKIRFQMVGNSTSSPTPHVRIDEITAISTPINSPHTLEMFDDGKHGDGSANDGIYGAAIPNFPSNITVNYSISASDSNGNTSSSNLPSYTVSSSLTDDTWLSPEFLGIPTQNGITFNAVANQNLYAYIEYGLQPGEYTQATTPTLFSINPNAPEYYNPIEIPISGLLENTKYYYRLRYKLPTDLSYGSRGERSFTTSKPRNVPFSFTITADPHLDVNSDLTLLSQTLANIAADQPDFHIDLGDIFMTDKMADGINGIPPEFGGGVLPNQQRVNDRALMLRNVFALSCHSIPFYYTLGNHEAEYGYLFNAATDKQNNIPAWNLKARKAFFPTPVPNTFYTGNSTPKDYTGGTLGLLENYYAWEWGDALFIVLDPFWSTINNPSQTNTAWNWTLGKPQYDWLQQTLEHSSAKYKFVFIHHLVGGTTTLEDGVTPNIAARGGTEVAHFYEWGGYNADSTTYGFTNNRPGWAMPIHQLLVKNHVNAVFHGHDHLYAYQTLDNIAYLECPQPGTANYVALGSAGDGKYKDGVILPNSGHIRISIADNQATAEYVRSYRPQDINTTHQNRDISHSFVMNPTTNAPISLTEKSATSTTIRWNSIPNTSYTIQWSTNLSNWQSIHTVTTANDSTQTQSSFTDTQPDRVKLPHSFYRVLTNPSSP